MNWLWTHWRLGVAVLFIAGANLVLGLCWRHNIWSLEALQVYGYMSAECPPAWRDYQLGRVRAGDPVEEVIAKTNPVKVEQKGRWTYLKYNGPGFTGLGGLAYDGRMVLALASSCSWTRVFFNDMTDEQCLELFKMPKDDPKLYGIGIVVR